jgi:hypothetical protein
VTPAFRRRLRAWPEWWLAASLLLVVAAAGAAAVVTLLSLAFISPP